MSNSDSERSPKRQRLNSYSPASTGCPSPKRQRTEQPFIQTPPPSVRMSPSWQSQSQQILHHSGGSNFPSPPSTAGYQNRMAEGGGDSGRQTPASQDDSELRRDVDGDAVMRDQREGTDADIHMADPEHRRSDHERLGGSGEVEPLPRFKVFAAPVPPSRPHPSQDLIELYGLKRIQANVRRRDPVTGAKINTMRKSYANKLKTLGLEGRNKAVPNQGELSGLLDPGWSQEMQPGSGVTLWDNNWSERGKLGDSNAEADLLSKLDAALKMGPGQLPGKERESWNNVLGLDDPSVPSKGATATAKAPLASNPALAKTSAAHAMSSSAPASPRNQIRPDRKGKKRSYDDSSFEGYNQGYDDDGYSTGGLDDTGRRRDASKRQKRKDIPSRTNSPAFNAPGAVGVRST
ncbi:hypothetical protein AC578_7979 [Pseudocercospora eumusae]|uniref:Mediator of RNA polymerase II transcription subunit 19 n=1 Tax=Pseudocercospora eumusae TaxID=321146 RepID=A0A139HPL0_9PEZI|nr:hypothetical protein AC578_7979 [Pseudocercospora eumusae]